MRKTISVVMVCFFFAFFSVSATANQHDYVSADLHCYGNAYLYNGNDLCFGTSQSNELVMDEPGSIILTVHDNGSLLHFALYKKGEDKPIRSDDLRGEDPKYKIETIQVEPGSYYVELNCLPSGCSYCGSLCDGFALLEKASKYHTIPSNKLLLNDIYTHAAKGKVVYRPFKVGEQTKNVKKEWGNPSYMEKDWSYYPKKEVAFAFNEETDDDGKTLSDAVMAIRAYGEKVQKLTRSEVEEFFKDNTSGYGEDGKFLVNVEGEYQLAFTFDNPKDKESHVSSYWVSYIV